MVFNGPKREEVYLGVKAGTDEDGKAENCYLTHKIHTIKIPIMAFLSSVFCVTKWG
ncbi:hypothetical protein ACVWZB_005034 [Paenibacillus polymyxa]|jgi:hypothetical protein|uniref:Uncharacterized protein n=1 Tax=Paenibacillus polymyxa TaxID=1406 RepID=A0A378XZL0_PAEPO|nr:Uncharacterised protein [Paenibacillus polymyxa]SUA69710.1 Uncharacterised protein [Paenibacillus polymyxa]